MQPVQFGLWLRFATEMRAQSLSQKILETLGGQVSRPERVPEPGFNLKVREDKDKVSVAWRPSSCYIVMELVADREHCTATIASLLEEINEVAPVGEITRRVTTYWILPAPRYDFASLERKYRETMIVQNVISNSAFDSSAIFDIRADKWTLHHQSGAMAPRQLLQQYLRFKLDNLPEAFIFLEATIFDANVVKYSREETYSFMRRALDRCITHSKSFDQVWEGRL